MGTIFMNSKNSETSNPHRLLIKLKYKINLKRSDKYVALSNLKFKISAPTQNEEFELPDGSYFMSDIQDYLNLSWRKNLERRWRNPSIRIYIKKQKM